MGGEKARDVVGAEGQEDRVDRFAGQSDVDLAVGVGCEPGLDGRPEIVTGKRGPTESKVDDANTGVGEESGKLLAPTEFAREPSGMIPLPRRHRIGITQTGDHDLAVSVSIDSVGQSALGFCGQRDDQAYGQERCSRAW